MSDWLTCAAAVLPDPVGAASSVSRPATIGGQLAGRLRVSGRVESRLEPAADGGMVVEQQDTPTHSITASSGEAMSDWLTCAAAGIGRWLRPRLSPTARAPA